MNKKVKSIKFNLSSVKEKELYEYCMKQKGGFSGFVKNVLYQQYLSQQTYLPLIADHDGVYRVKIEY